MDLWIFVGLLSLCLILIVVGLYKFRLLISLAGVFILVLAFAVQSEGLTIKTVANETSSFIYGNQTFHYQILNETESVASFPHIFTTIFTPLVANSNNCYYTFNNTHLNSVILDGPSGTINVTG